MDPRRWNRGRLLTTHRDRRMNFMKTTEDQITEATINIMAVIEWQCDERDESLNRVQSQVVQAAIQGVITAGIQAAQERTMMRFRNLIDSLPPQ